MKFNVTRFLRDKFNNPAGLVAYLAAYGTVVPAQNAEKWFYRQSVPSAWLPIILAHVELEEGAPVSLSPYMEAC
jgi:hypothetical protein